LVSRIIAMNGLASDTVLHLFVLPDLL
jgi:hypothetical protein